MYQTNKEQDGQILFYTNAGVKYTIVLSSAKEYFPTCTDWNDNLYSVVFDCHGQRVWDPKIMPTVCNALNEIAKDSIDIVFFWVCSTDDQQQAARHRLFTRAWKSYDNSLLKKFDAVIVGDNEQYYLSIVISKENRYMDEIVQTFYENADSLNKS